MNKPNSVFARFLLVAVPLLFVSTAGAQTPPFAIRVQQGQATTNVAAGDSFPMTADGVGRTATATLSLTSRVSSAVTIKSVDLTGSGDFAVSGSAATVVNPEQTISFTITFRPSSAEQKTSRLAITYSDVAAGPANTVTLTAIGTTPDFVVSYSTPSDGNTTTVSENGTILLSVAPVEGNSTTQIIVSNRGSGPGAIREIAVTGGPAFQLQNIPALPATAMAGDSVRFNIRFVPPALGDTNGNLTIAAGVRTLPFVLKGTAVGAQFRYESLKDDQATSLLAGQTLSFSGVKTGETETLRLRVRNSGNAEGRITALNIQGAAFQIVDAPFLPIVLATTSTATITVAFRPAQPGPATGRLQVGADVFSLTGNGVGPFLTFNYANGSTTTPVAGEGTVIFTPTAIGKSAAVRFTIANTGTADALIGSIGVADGNTIYTLAGVPQLPLTLQPGNSASFDVTFTPSRLGVINAILRIDAQAFTLSGLATAPPPLPSYRFEGPTGDVDPMQQPSVSLTLAEPYPLNVRGTLTMAFNSNVFSNDPSAQFANGGRTVEFTIPANATRATFPNNASQIRLQTGTVAASLTLTPSFTTEGGVDLTPASRPSLQLNVPLGVPRILSVQVTGLAQNTFTVSVTGFAPGRAVTQMEFTFTPAAGVGLPASRISVPVEGALSAWYQSTQSQQYGSMFTATLPFTVQVANPGTLTLQRALESISVRLINQQGTSEPGTVPFR